MRSESDDVANELVTEPTKTMPTHQRAAKRLLAIVAILFASQGHCQVTGTAPQYNWQDKEFAPDESNGALHLRIGFGGIAPGIPATRKPPLARGNSTCDMVYLYFSHSKRQLPKEYQEPCAIAEYELANGFTVEPMSALNNAFERQRVLTRYLPIVSQRMAAIGAAQRFYIKVPVQIMKVDPVQSYVDLTFDLNGNAWLGNLPGGRVVFKDDESAAGTYQPLQRVPQDLAQLLEATRLSRGEHYGDVYFSVKGTALLIPAPTHPCSSTSTRFNSRSTSLGRPANTETSRHSGTSAGLAISALQRVSPSAWRRRAAAPAAQASFKGRP